MLAELVEIRDRLLRGLDVPVVDGYAAFERHQLLAIRFHRAARVNAPEGSERSRWKQFFREHFPRGDEHAVRLWERWRNPLLKDEFPAQGVVVSHGQADAHWRLVTPGEQLYIDLESMRDDFAVAVESLVDLLERDAARRDASITHWAKTQWVVGKLTYSGLVTTTASAASAASFPLGMPPTLDTR